MADMGKLMEEMTQAGVLIDTAAPERARAAAFGRRPRFRVRECYQQDLLRQAEGDGEEVSAGGVGAGEVAGRGGADLRAVVATARPLGERRQRGDGKDEGEACETDEFAAIHESSFVVNA
jgi:hypothetical protein